MALSTSKTHIFLITALTISTCFYGTTLARPPTGPPTNENVDPKHPNLTPHGSDPNRIPGEFIVTFRKGLTAESPCVVELLPELIALGAQLNESRNPLSYGKVYQILVSITLLNNSGQALVLAHILASDCVEYVIQNRQFSFTAEQTQNDPPNWGLDRIDQRSLPLDDEYTYDNGPDAVNIYIVDTGVANHQDFGSRVSTVYNSVSGETSSDCNGHGTHVAGIAASTTYGVAKAANIKAVKVLGCSGSGDTLQVIDGLNWIALNHEKPAVVSLSLGGEAYTPIDQAVKNLINLGLTVVVAAGNDDADACNSSPARVPEAITVGAVGSSDSRAGFSNYGTCVDIFAPGVDILSTWLLNTTDTLSGTSQATPHVSGVAALYLSHNPDADNGEVAGAIVEAATEGELSGIDNGSPNQLLYSRVSQVSSSSSPCTECEIYFGTVTEQAGAILLPSDMTFQPNNTYYEVTAENQAGYHRGWLRQNDTASGNDYDLYLFYWEETINNWKVVSVSNGPSTSESIVYQGASGAYIWGISSSSGSGPYNFYLERPNPDTSSDGDGAGSSLRSALLTHVVDLL